MTDIVGIWSKQSSQSTRQFVERFSASIQTLLSGDYKEEFTGALWLVSNPDNRICNDHSCAAIEGYLPNAINRDKLLNTILSNGIEVDQLVDGFYSVIHTDINRTELSLMRSHSGGERLYYFQTDDIVVFSSTIRPLISISSAVNKVATCFNKNKLADIVYSGLPLFDDASLIEGINEVLPGHLYRFCDDQVSHQWCWPTLLQPPSGRPEDLAVAFRQKLLSSICDVIGSQKQVAVTLSGGIDSAAIAALAVEAVGADNVVAYTYEFDDSQHPVETPYAVEVCKKLGIQQHKIFQITLEEYLRAIPETIWRSEHMAHWSKAFMLPVAKRIRDDGFDQYLSGFGVGSHMGFLQEISPFLNGPLLPLLAKFWRYGQSTNWLSLLEKIHPIMAVPNRRLFYLMVKLLESYGKLTGSNLLPTMPQLTSHGEGMVKEGVQFDSIDQLIRYYSFTHLLSCVDVTRWEKPMRELGIHRVSPAHFISCLPYAYLPLQAKAVVWSEDRGLRPGKQLLRLAMKGVLPDSVLYRKKSWADAVVSPKWSAAGIRWMRQSTSNPPLKGITASAESLGQWDQYAPQASLSALTCWHKLFVELPPTNRVPEWSDITQTTIKQSNSKPINNRLAVCVQ